MLHYLCGGQQVAVRSQEWAGAASHQSSVRDLRLDAGRQVRLHRSLEWRHQRRVHRQAEGGPQTWLQASAEIRADVRAERTRESAGQRRREPWFQRQLEASNRAGRERRSEVGNEAAFDHALEPRLEPPVHPRGDPALPGLSPLIHSQAEPCVVSAPDTHDTDQYHARRRRDRHDGTCRLGKTGGSAGSANDFLDIKSGGAKLRRLHRPARRGLHHNSCREYEWPGCSVLSGRNEVNPGPLSEAARAGFECRGRHIRRTYAENSSLYAAVTGGCRIRD